MDPAPAADALEDGAVVEAIACRALCPGGRGAYMRCEAGFPGAIVFGAKVVTVSRVAICREDAVRLRYWVDDKKSEVKSSHSLLSTLISGWRFGLRPRSALPRSSRAWSFVPIFVHYRRCFS